MSGTERPACCGWSRLTTARRSTTPSSTGIFGRTGHEAALPSGNGQLYIELKAAPGAETREVAPGLSVDLDAAGDVVGFDIDGASRRLDLTTLETIALPTKATKAA